MYIISKYCTLFSLYGYPLQPGDVVKIVSLLPAPFPSVMSFSLHPSSSPPLHLLFQQLYCLCVTIRSSPFTPIGIHVAVDMGRNVMEWNCTHLEKRVPKGLFGCPRG